MPSFAAPAWLWLLPLALLPLVASPLRRSQYPSLQGVARDLLSSVVAALLRLAAMLAIAATILGLAGPVLSGGSVERIGAGAHVVLLIDRSGSMNNSFAGGEATSTEESKASAAARLLKDFVTRRGHDQFGVVDFSTMPVFVMPITPHRAAVLGAIDVIDRPGLAKTDVGRGLAMALDMIRADPAAGAPAILLVSDGAAVIDRRVQADLRAAFRRSGAHLYWLFLRTAGSRGIFDPPPPGQDTPQAMPERHLNIFFQGLGVPYRAFEAENADAVQQAMATIDRIETRPVAYVEQLPRRDASGIAYAIAATSVLLLVLAKLAEAGLAVPRQARGAQP